MWVVVWGPRRILCISSENRRLTNGEGLEDPIRGWFMRILGRSSENTRMILGDYVGHLMSTLGGS